MKLIIFFCLWTMVVFAQVAVGAETRLEPIEINLKDKPALQRGAATFMNYCSGCHSLKYLRYSRLGKDLAITTYSGKVDNELLYNNLIFTKAKVNDPIRIALPEKDARTWFGIDPPDLSLKVRERGAAWIYTYLTSFYADNSRPFGANNIVLPDTAMPNVLLNLSGRKIAVRDKVNGVEIIDYLETVENGIMSEHQFNSTIKDLVNFLAYVSEPARLERYRIGTGVLIFLGLFLIVAYLLKKTYWAAVKK